MTKKNNKKLFGATAVKLPSDTGFVVSNMMSLDQAWLCSNTERPFAVFTEIQ